MALVPQHVAIIMDGNGRWAQRRMLPRIAGHRKGVETAKMVVQRCLNLQIKALTVFAFSSENWRRPSSEVKLLMSLLHDLLGKQIAQLHENNVKLAVIGDLQRLSPEMQAAIAHAEEQTKDNQGLCLNIALNYGGRWDIVQAAKALCADVQDGRLAVADINQSVFGNYVCLGGLPEPDLLIRTSGEQRISNFLLWQLAYTELYFTPVLWPDFSIQDFDTALDFYAKRQRRFGLVIDTVDNIQNA